MLIEQLIEFYAPENSNLKFFSLENKFSFEVTSKTEQRLVFFFIKKKKTNQFYIIILTINMQN